MSRLVDFLIRRPEHVATVLFLSVAAGAAVAIFGYMVI